MTCGGGANAPSTLSSSTLLMYKPERGALTVPLLRVVTCGACQAQLEVCGSGVSGDTLAGWLEDSGTPGTLTPERPDTASM